MYNKFLVKLSSLFLILIALLLITGCPVTEENPIDNANLTPPTQTDVKTADDKTTSEATDKSNEATTASQEKYEPTSNEESTKPDEAKSEEKPAEDSSTEAAINKTKVRFETQLGNIDILVHPEWDLYAAKRFLDLVKDGFYTNAPWFRIVPDFVIQCGVSGKPELQAKWGMNTFNDSPVLKGNEPWTLAFGKSGMPNSRSTHIFINLKDNRSSLDPQGFSAFAEVIAGKEVVEKIVKKSGAKPGEDFSVDQGKMQMEGVEFIKSDPTFKDKIVWIKKATILK